MEIRGSAASLGVLEPARCLRVCYLIRVAGSAWIVRLVHIGVDDGKPFVDVMNINRSDDHDDIAHLGLALA